MRGFSKKTLWFSSPEFLLPTHRSRLIGHHYKVSPYWLWGPYQWPYKQVYNFYNCGYFAPISGVMGPSSPKAT